MNGDLADDVQGKESIVLTREEYNRLLEKVEITEGQNKLLKDRLDKLESVAATQQDLVAVKNLAMAIKAAETTASQRDCLEAGRAYLQRHQYAYAIAAFAIGTLITIFPLYGTRQLNMDVSVVGYVMTGGELLGILTTYYAEQQTTGFFLLRPFDLYFILASLGVGVASVAVWPTDLYIGACASVIYVQLINSPSRTVIGECISRLASALDTEQAVALAKANSFRRFGNTIIGVCAILTYTALPPLFFFIAGGCILLLIPELIRVQQWIVEMHVKHDHVLNSNTENAAAQTGRTHMPGESDGPPMGHAITFIATVADETRSGQDGQDSAHRGDVQKSSFLTMFVIIHVFSVMDAWISRFPFVWFAVEIMEHTDDALLAAACLALYQLCRAISQSLQLWGFTKALHHFCLNIVAVMGYAVMMIMLLENPNFEHWYILVIFTGFAETLPTQQRCLMDALNIPNGASLAEKEPIRKLVKKTHFGTSVGSALAFVSTALVYNVCKGDDILVAIAALGVVVGMLKVFTVIYIAVAVGQRGLKHWTLAGDLPVVDEFFGHRLSDTEDIIRMTAMRTASIVSRPRGESQGSNMNAESI